MVGGDAHHNKPDSARGELTSPAHGHAGATLATAYLLVGFAMARTCSGPADTPVWLIGFGLQWALYVALLLRGPRTREPLPLLSMLGCALAARWMLIGTTPWLSDDLYRYLLDGQVWAHGINPYRLPPADPQIQAIAPALAAYVNHPQVPTIYPPAAQLLFLGAAALRLGLLGWRLLTSLADVLVAVAVLRLFGGGVEGRRAAAVYALCPLAVWEAGANGHLEAWAALPLVWGAAALSRGRSVWGGALLGIATLVKLYPALLLPLWLRRRGFVRASLACAGVVVVGFGPFVAKDADVFAGLRTYLAHWSFNSPVHELLQRMVPDRWGTRALPFLLAALAATVAGRRGVEVARGARAVLLTFLLAGPTLHPWYALWVAPWLGPRPTLFAWTAVAVLGGGYAVWWNVARAGAWALPQAAAIAIWGSMLAALLLSLGGRWYRRRR